jgi:LysR substrate binding domain
MNRPFRLAGALAGMRQVSVAQLADDRFVSLPAYEGLVLPDRLRRLARASGFVANVVQIAPDTQTAMALVSVEVGCHLTFASGARNATDPRIVFGPLAEAAAPDLDVDLRAAWRRDDRASALHSVLDCLFTLDDDTDGTPRSRQQA